MSLASNLFKGGVVIALLAGVGWGFGARSQAQRNYQSDVEQLATTKHEYQHELHMKPQKKVVTTNYQKALTAANKYLAVSNKLHDQGNARTKKAQKYMNQMDDMTMDGSTGPLVGYTIKDWTGTAAYGGQTSNGKVLVSFKFVNKQNKVMQLTTAYYHPKNNKLSGFTTYMSRAGAQENRSTLKG